MSNAEQDFSLSEHELAELIKEIAVGYRYKHRFAYYEPEDIEQEVAEKIIQGIKHYRPERGDLRRFLRVHVKNRLLNLKRKKFVRIDRPVCTCQGNPCECAHIMEWVSRNEARKNIVSPIGLDEINDYDERGAQQSCGVLSGMIGQEMLEIIDGELAPSLRRDYLLWMGGARMGEVREQRLLGAVKTILVEWGYGRET